MFKFQLKFGMLTELNLWWFLEVNFGVSTVPPAFCHTLAYHSHIAVDFCVTYSNITMVVSAAS
jgi:hypothetical protein